MVGMPVFIAVSLFSFFGFVSCSTSPKSISVIDLPLMNVENSLQILPITRQQEEKAVFAVNNTISGFARTTETGLTVQRGTSAKLRFRIQVDAIEVDKLVNFDGEFVKSLDVFEQAEYKNLRDDYQRDLKVPFLKWLGIDLIKRRTTREDMEAAFKKRVNYNKQARVATKILSNVQEQRLQISGEITAHGTSFIPTTVFAFIRIARVQTQEGKTFTVVSKSGSDVVAASPTGKLMPSTQGLIDIVSL